jgi:Flp pilus assembly protein TadG
LRINVIASRMDSVYLAKGRSKNLVTRMKGQSMVEFALVLPLLVLIIAGIFDLGRAFFALITITNAAREGARFGSLHADNIVGACDATKNEALNSGISIAYSNITVMCGNTMTCQVSAGTSCTRNQPITVKVGYNYTDMIFKFFFPSGIYMQRQVEMLIP